MLSLLVRKQGCACVFSLVVSSANAWCPLGAAFEGFGLDEWECGGWEFVQGLANGMEGAVR